MIVTRYAFRHGRGPGVGFDKDLRLYVGYYDITLVLAGVTHTDETVAELVLTRSWATRLFARSTMLCSR